MKAKPGAITLLAILQLIAPIGNILSGAVISKNGFIDYFLFLKANDPSFLVTHLWVPLLAAISIYAVKIWSIPLFLFTLLYSLSRIHIHSSGWVPLWGRAIPYLAILINGFLFIYICLPQVRKIYLDRRNRWWDSVRRFHVNWACTLVSANGDVRVGLIDFFSDLGVFATMDLDEKMVLGMGDVFTLKFSFERRSFSIQVKVVNRMMANPKQVGLTYLNLTILQKIQLWTVAQILEFRKTERRPERVSHIKEFTLWTKSFLK